MKQAERPDIVKYDAERNMKQNQKGRQMQVLPEARMNEPIQLRFRANY
jgi:hypothetical protein